MLLNLKAKRAGAGGGARIPPMTNGKSKTRTRTRNDRGSGRGNGKEHGRTAMILEEDYDKMVEEIADKLLDRLPRMPFPPTSTSTSSASADDTFDLSGTLHRISTLQAQLATDTQSARLLRRAMTRETRALKRDRAELAGLEAASKANGRKERGHDCCGDRGGWFKVHGDGTTLGPPTDAATARCWCGW
jgi:hypothetical protein